MQPNNASSSGIVDFRLVLNSDTDFLFRLYSETRAWEVQITDENRSQWSETDEYDFLKFQFEAQSQSYAAQFPNAVHRIITFDQNDVGRLICDVQDDHLRIVDISLFRAYQGKGIGGDILRSLMHQADGGKVPIRLHVDRLSPARRLYDRLGFKVTSELPNHVAMERAPVTHPVHF